MAALCSLASCSSSLWHECVKLYTLASDAYLNTRHWGSPYLQKSLHIHVNMGTSGSHIYGVPKLLWHRYTAGFVDNIALYCYTHIIDTLCCIFHSKCSLLRATIKFDNIILEKVPSCICNQSCQFCPERTAGRRREMMVLSCSLVLP